MFNNKKELSFNDALKEYYIFLEKMYNLILGLFYEILDLGPENHLTIFLENIINSRLESSEKKNLNEYFNILTGSIKSSWTEKEKIDFLN